MRVVTVRILTVCTGNICRSPYAELLLARDLESVRPGAFEVSSAGVGALVGHPVDPGSARHLARQGIAHDQFRARQVSPAMLQDVDLVLGMAVPHRQAVLREAPRLLRRTFTIKELARLLESAGRRRPWTDRLAGLATPEERWAAIPDHLARERGLTGAAGLADGADDVADPYRRDGDAFDLMARDIEVAVERVAALEASF